jgi:hypothetical protein
MIGPPVFASLPRVRIEPIRTDVSEPSQPAPGQHRRQGISIHSNALIPVTAWPSTSV